MFVIPEGNLLMFVIPEGNLLMFVIPEGNLRLPLLVLTGIWRLENSKLNRARFCLAVPIQSNDPIKPFTPNKTKT
jgi:hypothetical protein